MITNKLPSSKLSSLFHQKIIADEMGNGVDETSMPTQQIVNQSFKDNFHQIIKKQLL